MSRRPKFKVGDRVRTPHGSGIVLDHKVTSQHSQYQVLLLQAPHVGGRIRWQDSASLRKMSRSAWSATLRRIVAWNRHIEDRGCDCHCCPHVSEQLYG